MEIDVNGTTAELAPTNGSVVPFDILRQSHVNFCTWELAFTPVKVKLATIERIPGHTTLQIALPELMFDSWLEWRVKKTIYTDAFTTYTQTKHETIQIRIRTITTCV